MTKEKRGFWLAWDYGRDLPFGDFRIGGLKGKVAGDLIYWERHRDDLEAGDIAYIRNQNEPMGVVAKAIVTNTRYHSAPDFRLCIELRLEDIRLDCRSGMLPNLILSATLPPRLEEDKESKFIPAYVLDSLNSVWELSKGKHSLKAYVEWLWEFKSENLNGWLRRYEEVVGLMADIKVNNNLLNEKALARIWKEQSNGVSSVGSAFLYEQDFQKNRDWLTRATFKILENPDRSTYDQIYSEWRAAKENGSFSRICNLVINRVFAAAAPLSFTSVVAPDKADALASIFEHIFQLHSSRHNWFDINTSIVNHLSAIGLSPNDCLKNNIAMWMLYETYDYQQKEMIKRRSNHIAEELPLVHKDIEMNLPLNQVLFGPPGTGKTYHTIDEALRILEPSIFETVANLPATEARSQLSERFNFYRSEDRIVFCTFHQSFSYEDFVEGLRAEVIDDKVNYIVGRGVFKKLCDDITTPKGVLSIDDAVSRFIEDTAENPVVLETATGKKFNVRYKPGNTTLTCTPQASKSGLELPANINHVRDVLQGNTPENIYCESYVKGIVSHIKQKYLQITDTNISNHNDGAPRVFIIDEINRGNISKIFGELITLIEPSKRAGEKEALEVILPYSKKPFSVPPNLYIIGTMNTSDRSLAGLDIALRRRFTFKEMLPKPELLNGVTIEGINIGELLRVMNQRIEVLLGRDYCLGHAYFMSLTSQSSITDLATIFQKQIFPLLQEYFFEDWQRIQWVLNDHRKKANHFVTRQAINGLDDLFGAEVAISDHQLPWIINKEAFISADAYKGIIKAVNL